MEHLFEVTIAKDVSEDHILAVQGRIEKLLTEISAVGDGDLRVHAEVTLDTIGVLADSFNYLIEELAAVIIRVQMTTSAVTEGTDVLVNAIHAQERVIETITNITQHESSSPSEKMKYIGITNETQRLEKVMKSMMSQTEQMRKIVDALYVSVSGFLLPDISSFRLPQNTPASWSPLFDLNKKS